MAHDVCYCLSCRVNSPDYDGGRRETWPTLAFRVSRIETPYDWVPTVSALKLQGFEKVCRSMTDLCYAIRLGEHPRTQSNWRHRFTALANMHPFETRRG